MHGGVRLEPVRYITTRDLTEIRPHDHFEDSRSTLHPDHHYHHYLSQLLNHKFLVLCKLAAQRLEMEAELRSTLLRCSLVCKTFCDPDLSALWWRLDNLVPLLRLLSCFVPTKVKRKGRVRQGGDPKDDTLYVSPTYLQSTRLCSHGRNLGSEGRAVSQGLGAVPPTRPPRARPQLPEDRVRHAAHCVTTLKVERRRTPSSRAEGAHMAPRGPDRHCRTTCGDRETRAPPHCALMLLQAINPNSLVEFRQHSHPQATPKRL